MKEAKHPLYYSYIANCVINAISASTAIILNTLAIQAMRKTSSLPKPLKTLLLSLAVSDLGVGLLVQPFTVALMVKHMQQNNEVGNPAYSLNKAYYCFTVIFFQASFFTVVVISIDRFLAIHLHLRYQELVTYKRAVAVVISVWVLSVLFLLISLWIEARAHALIIIVILGLCLSFTAVVYCRIYFAVRRHTNHIQALQVQDVYGEMANAVKQRKTSVSTFYVYLVFLACILPQYCASIASMFREAQSTALVGFRLYSWTLVFLNSSLNPLIYCWKMGDIRHAIMDILRNIFPHRN